MTTFHKITFASVLGLSLLAGGCNAFNDDRSDRDRYDDRYDTRSSRSSRDRYDDGRVSRGDVEREAGAARALPRDARLVDEVRSGRMSYTARDRGTVYLYDATARRIIWDGRVDDGARVSVIPDKNRIEVNGREQADIDLKSNNRFELYFSDRR